MSNWSAGASWEYSRWMKNYARNARITLPGDVLPYAGELTRVRTFLKVIWDPMTQTGTRPWLEDAFLRKATAAAGGDNYQCNLDNETPTVLVELLEVVGRDLKKLPVTAGEVAAAGVLFGGAPARVFGTTPTYGGVGGAVVSIP